MSPDYKKVYDGNDEPSIQKQDVLDNREGVSKSHKPMRTRTVAGRYEIPVGSVEDD